ncbi:beta-ribofuranosylaminobenzene 5'-phosphate synthase family protein [Stygiolobus caldivivus]|uniref:Beta-ribofuranosylaminobenzene 5'-phosphate synthase n=1 Tax=Stygiolobus caldivivus TaxID=2824673 RepID=A0A8D5U8P7_9CREN|nr:beta-ribofuranosylaminobenzene 5'-phosphate synthase family protein [Stygiolobus caldivivus]BCU70779.1 beta-ribofuranosylaminobenzene 5'-phosphate synthase [Stygiolobus caldivivus]
MIKIIGLSRIHITLLDLEGKYGRIDGGVGVALKYPKIVVSEGNCKKETEFPLPYPLPGYCVHEDYEEHIGLGHTTQFRLSLAKLSAEYNLKNADVVELARAVGRGGTSGIGVYAFKYGGFIVDGGHSLKVKKEVAPSDFSTAPPPPLIARYDFPWYIYVNIPARGRRIFGKEELDAFKKEAKEIDKLVRVVYMKLIPNIIEKDLGEVLESIKLIQQLGFKRVEVSLQTEEVRELMKKLETKGFPAGISSFGPAVYTFVSSRTEGEELVSYFGGFISEPNNEGAKVVWSKD